VEIYGTGGEVFMSELIPWRGEMERLRNEMDRLYERFFDWRPLRRFGEAGEWMPSVDISETEKEIIVKAEVPGMESKDIHVSIDGNVLTLRGERKHEKEEKGENFHRVERSYGNFSRSIRLPADVAQDKAKASYKRGILKITMPKTQKESVKKIQVKTI
jgi:HSP20 family protein